MTRLTDTQLVILSAAAQRDDGAVLPLPDTLKLKGGAVDKVLGSLKTKGLIDHPGHAARRRPATAPHHPRRPRGHRRRDRGRRRRGRDAGRHGRDVSRCRSPGYRCVAPATEADSAAPRRPRRGRRPSARRGSPRPRGRQAHAARRHQAGAADRHAQAPRGRYGRADRRSHRLAAPYHPGRHLRRAQEKLGFTIEATRTREVGPNKGGAKGSTTVYRITGSSPSTE